MKTKHTMLFLFLAFLLTSCSSVDVTKTNPGFFDATDPNTVEILKTEPDRKFIEVGTVTATGFGASETARMHNAIRSEAAKLGANAVILQDEGITPAGFGSYNRWTTGVAIRYE